MKKMTEKRLRLVSFGYPYDTAFALSRREINEIIAMINALDPA